MIIAISIIVLFFIWGIVDPSVFQYEGGSYYRPEEYYGVMYLPSAFLVWFIWQVIGLVTAGLTYCLLKIAFSYKVLNIIYLQRDLMSKEVPCEIIMENKGTNSLKKWFSELTNK